MLGKLIGSHKKPLPLIPEGPSLEDVEVVNQGRTGWSMYGWKNGVCMWLTYLSGRCLYCGRCFARKSTLDNHVRVHTGERPYSCSACGKSYKHSAGLWQHMAQTHRGLPRRRRLNPAVPESPRHRQQPGQQPASYTCPVRCILLVCVGLLQCDHQSSASPSMENGARVPSTSKSLLFSTAQSLTVTLCGCLSKHICILRHQLW